MSDNKNQNYKKSKSRWLIPIVIALVLGFVVVQLLLLDETSDQQLRDEIEKTTENVSSKNINEEKPETYSLVEEYILFVSNNSPEETSIFISEYISTALNHLTDALEELSEEEEISLNTSLFTQLKAKVDTLAVSENQKKTLLVRNSFIMISEAIAPLKDSGSDSLKSALKTLHGLAYHIELENNIEEQEDTVSKFLKQAAIVLELIQIDA